MRTVFLPKDYKESLILISNGPLNIPVIGTGFMVRNKIQRETHKRGTADSGKFLFPVGKTNRITVYPMTFDEFLLNRNNVLYEKVKAFLNQERH